MSPLPIHEAPQFVLALERELQAVRDGKDTKDALRDFLFEFHGDTVYISSRWYEGNWVAARVLELYAKGVPAPAIAERLGRTRGRIYQILSSHGVSPN